MAEKEREKEGGLPKAAIAVVVVAVIAITAFIVLGRKQTFEKVGPGSNAIEFTLPDLDGNPVKLSDFRGKVVFLNFWATWCKPCEEEMPSMQELYEGLKGQPFEILAVSVDTEGPDTVRKYAQKYGITFRVLHDRKGKIKETYKTTGVPETFIIDQKGVIAEKVWGPRDWAATSSQTVLLDVLKNGPKPPESYMVKQAGKKAY